MTAPAYAPLGVLSPRPLRSVTSDPLLTRRAVEPPPTQSAGAPAPRVRKPTKQQRRRLNFIRAERLSYLEAADIPGSFDPGPEYDHDPTA